MKTWNAKPGEVEQKWYVVDATGKTLGRLASEVAKVIRGKHKPEFTPHVDTGDFVIVINSKDIAMGGNKWATKKYYRHSGYFGSLKETTAEELREKNSPAIIENAVRGMLPKNRLGRQLIKKLKAYDGATHPHDSQKPEALSL